MDFYTRHAEHLRHNESLAKYTAARIGGLADTLFIAHDNTALSDVLIDAWTADIPTRILGGGANVLIGDGGMRGLVVIDAVRELMITNETVVVSGGYALTLLARKCAAQGLAGFEWGASVPGTVGGAVVNNAGAHNGDMAGNLLSAAVLRIRLDGRAETVMMTQDDLAYAYRTSALKSAMDRRFCVLSAQLQLHADDPDAIHARMDTFIAQRKRTQPPGASLGSIFKNPPGDYAGRLIESCGLKGHTIGSAQVSPVHANFFIHTGIPSATPARDYAALIDHVQHLVEAQTGVEMEVEVERIGEFRV